MSTKPRTAYQQFVSDFAAQNKGQKWGPGGLMRAAAQAWRDAGHVPKSTSKPRSACAGKVRTDCTPPCVWTNGPKRQYCHAKPVGKGKGSGAPRPRATLSKPYHSCSKLTDAELCDVAPHCYWKPNEKVCRTRSGAGVKQLMQGQDRQSMLAGVRSYDLRSLRAPRASQQGGSQFGVGEQIERFVQTLIGPEEEEEEARQELTDMVNPIWDMEDSEFVEYVYLNFYGEDPDVNRNEIAAARVSALALA